MQNIRPFQIALLALFAVMGVASLMLLASFEGFIIEDENIYGERVVIWGPFDQSVVDDMLRTITNERESFDVVEYVQRDSRTFETELVNAVAEGRGPDVIIMPHEELVTYRSKLLPIPYDTFSERQFRDRFIDGAEIFTLMDGIYAFPFAVDPIVMYWNRDMFSTSGLSVPPSSWEAVVSSVVPSITRRDSNRNIGQSAIAFGEYQNVSNAKEMLLTLIMQSGSRLIEEEERGYKVEIDDSIAEGGRPPMNAAVQFYTDFSNANSPLYSWNRAMENDRIAFLGGDLGLYFGYGSEYGRLQSQNPNLNFDVAAVPQGASATVRRVYGTFYGFAIMRTSQNPEGSYAAIQTLLQDNIVGRLTEQLSLAPVSRALIAAGSNDPYRQVAMDSALIARGWLDPDPEESDSVFRQMVEDIVSSRLKVTNAVSDAVRRLELAF